MKLKLAAVLSFAVSVAFAQTIAGCTPVSMTAARAGSIVTPGVGRWSCYAVNYGPNSEPFSPAMFALDFPELHLIPAEQMNDIIQVKQNRSWQGIAVKVLGYALIGAVVVTGSGAAHVNPTTVSRLAMGALGAGKLSDQLNRDIPASAPFLSDLFVSDVTLSPYGKPGFWKKWTAYSSLIGPAGTKALGPRPITGPAEIKWLALPIVPPGTNSR